MFSLAAINDTDSRGQWEPLAPTKEAQEFHLSQTYHEGLLKLEAKEYMKARELFEAVLKDPLVSSAQVQGNASDGHLLQLRFLTLKNLATVFLQQGSSYNESALHCYLQAVEIDTKDSVIWNQLGTLSCSMGSLSISRWAFEQGLCCSPNNWICMEKLLEVLIAIRDEVACLSVAELILRHWPSHSRALHVKNTIQELDPIPFAPRGIDRLEPKHARLMFPEKRKRKDENSDKLFSSKKMKTCMEVHLLEASWASFVDAILGILPSMNQASDSEQIVGLNQEDSMQETVDLRQAKVPLANTELQRDRTDPLQKFRARICDGKLERCGDIRLSIQLPSSSEDIVGPSKKNVISACENKTFSDPSFEKASVMKEREPCVDDEHPQERRSTRLERLRSRKPGKEELEFSTIKDVAKIVNQFLEPFIIARLGTKYYDHAANGDPCSDVRLYPSSVEQNEVKLFVEQTKNNYGAYHMGHLVLEEVASRCIPYQEHFVKFLELEKLTRFWGQDRTTDCCLFLAELYHELGLCSFDNSKRTEFFHESSYHLCKVIELVAFDFSPEESEASKYSQNSDLFITDDSACEELLLTNPILDSRSSFWARFFWLSGCLSILAGDKTKAYREFSLSLILVKNHATKNGPCPVSRPHCKLTKELTIDRVLHEIRLLKVDSLSTDIIGSMIEKEMYLDCVNLLAPLLLSSKEVYPELLPRACKESEDCKSVELSALDVLVMACEKAKPMDIDVYLKCHRRKLQVLTVAAGMDECMNPYKALNRKLMLKPSSVSELEPVESSDWHCRHLVGEEVQAISRCASQVKNFMDQCGSFNGLHLPVSTAGDIQVLLLTVICHTVRRFLCKKSSGLGITDQTEQLESRYLLDAVIAFCKLQHLDQSVPIKAQVELIAAIHELLAEYGLCCAGKDSEGEEGTFLKFSIKHLLALDMKKKSSIHSSSVGLEATQRNETLFDDTEVKVYAKESNLCDPSIVDTSHIVKDGTVTTNMDAKEGLTSEGTYTNGREIGKQGIDGKSHHLSEEKAKDHDNEHEDDIVDPERDVELGIDNALDQCFFCLYGLNLRSSDASCDDDLAMHKNTSRGDYQNKEQCADVFQYILPYAKASSRTGLVKVRRVLRAIRKQFPQPPEEILRENSIDNFLDNADLCEDKLCDEFGSDGFLESIMNMIFPSGRRLKQCRTTMGSSEPYGEVYGNLYHFLAQAEEMSATDKWPGFVLTKEGEDFVEQNANLFKYDLLYNPLRFESWQKLANIYDEEVDLLLNDGSKHVNVVGWRKNPSFLRRVETSRRRSRRCLLMSLALAKTPVQQSEIHELLALVYYDGIQNVVPIYDQRSVVPMKDASWIMFCQNSMKHFEKAFAHKPDWSHAFYMGKLCEKLGYPFETAFSYYEKAIALNPSAVDPVYRMHSSRLKMLFKDGQRNFDALKVIAAHSFDQSTTASVMGLIGSTGSQQLPVDAKECNNQVNSEEPKHVGTHDLDKAWHLLHKDCLCALETCVEGELKHFHKARYMLARGWYKRRESGDLEKAKEELSFCFKSSRSFFTINMWEIDSMVRKGRRKTPGLTGNKKLLEVNLPESSRKFITCIRKYILFYLKLLQETGDICTLDRAYTSLRTDKRFSLCLEDLVPVALARFIQTLISSIQGEIIGVSASSISSSSEHLLERMFNLFMDQVNLWADISSLPEIKSPELSESNFYGYLHQYIHSLERDLRFDVLEGINEKIRKRFKNPKLSNNSSAKVCKHASVAWCRAIVISLAQITPLNPETSSVTQVPIGAENSVNLCVDLKGDELWTSMFEDPVLLKDLETKWNHLLAKIKGHVIKQASEKNMEAAITLLRHSYNFYRESSCGVLPSGIVLYTVPVQLVTEGLVRPGLDGVEIIDLSVPRKLLLWAYTLVHGRYSNILVVVKHCEENAKSKMRKGGGMSSAASNTNSQAQTAMLTGGGSGKERVGPEESGEVEYNQQPTTAAAATAPAPASLADGEGGAAPDSDMLSSSNGTHKTAIPAASQLQQCNNNNNSLTREKEQLREASGRENCFLNHTNKDNQ